MAPAPRPAAMAADWRLPPRVTTHPAGPTTAEPTDGAGTGEPHAHDHDEAPDPADGQRRRAGEPAAVRLEGLEKHYGDVVAVAGIDLEIARRRVLLDARAVGLGQDDDAADDRGLRAADGRPGLAPRPRRHPARAVRARRQHRVPGLRAVPAHDGRRERRLRPASSGRSRRPSGERRVGDALAMVRLERLRAAQARPALRRPAAARRARAGAREPAARPAARRAPRRARPQAARGDADRAAPDPARGRDHVHLRDPRPGGGAHDERPDRGVQRRPDRAGRRAGRGLRATGDARSWPGSSGPRTCSTGDAAGAILGRAGTFTVRPEKIRLEIADDAPADAAVADDEYAAAGRIRSVVYLGPDTRYYVALDAGGELVVTQQNLATTSTEVLAQQGRAVRLTWKRQHTQEIAEA